WTAEHMTDEASFRSTAIARNGDVIYLGGSENKLDNRGQKEELALLQFSRETGEFLSYSAIGVIGRDETAYALQILENGEIIAAGTSSNAAYAARFDAAGQAIEGYQLSAQDNRLTRARIQEIAVVDDGFIFVGNHTNGFTDESGFLTKTDPNGRVMWYRDVGVRGFEHSILRDVKVRDNGLIVAAGYLFSGSSHFWPTSSSAHVVAYLPDGTLAWQHALSPGDYLEQASALELTAEGDLLVAGASRLFGDGRFQISKLNPEGDVLWRQRVGGQTVDAHNDLSLVADGEARSFTLLSTVRSSNGILVTRASQVETYSMPSDINQDGRLDIADGVCLLDFLFGAGQFPLPCGDGRRTDPSNQALLDGTGDRRVDISDAIQIFGVLFLGSPPPVLGRSCVRIEGCPGVCSL
ncbi:MAG: hypothetical protein AAF488_11425, partial [Planctomycetota bacterium]